MNKSQMMYLATIVKHRQLSRAQLSHYFPAKDALTSSVLAFLERRKLIAVQRVKGSDELTQYVATASGIEFIHSLRRIVEEAPCE